MIKLFHVSDVHFGAEDPVAIDWFATCVRDECPDAVIMTGDLTMRALPREFEAGSAWLKSLGVPVTVEIGNHDIPYYDDPIRRLFRPYHRYAAIEAMVEQPLTLPGVTVVPLKTIARLQWRVDQSKGRVSATSLAAAIARIALAPKEDAILVAAHHPLIEGLTTGGGRTRGGAAALSALAVAGADAVLTGHVHDPFDIPVERAGRTLRMIGAGTLSRRIRSTPPAFNELRIASKRIETRARLLDRSMAAGVAAAH